MKVLFYIESLRSGGKERRLVELIKGIVSYHPDIKVTLVLLKNEIHYHEILNLGIKILFTERKYFKKDPSVFFTFFKIVKQEKPDLIHAFGNMACIYAIPAKVLYSIPLINNEIADAPVKLPKGILNHRLTFPFSDKIIANSFAGINSYSPNPKKSLVICNGFDFSRIEKLENKEKLKNEFNIKTEFIVGMVATFNEFKDYKTYINAANIILSKNKDVTFLCVGDGDYKSYENIIPKENKNYIKFLGKQSNIESIENICDVGVLTTFGEGIPNAIMEFMALGKPVVVTDLGGSAELVSNDNNGYLIKPFDVPELVKKINYLLNNETERINLGKRGVEIISDEFNISKMINQFVAEYKKILNK